MSPNPECCAEQRQSIGSFRLIVTKRILVQLSNYKARSGIVIDFSAQFLTHTVKYSGKSSKVFTATVT